MRIAIVNDQALAREALRRVVASTQAHTVAWMAEDGESAVARAEADPPDLILMDLIMPGMGGVEATRRIMARRACPILLVTASVATNYRQVCEAMGHGGLDAINTPVLDLDGTIRDARPLVDCIARIDRLRRAASASSACRSSPEPAQEGAPGSDSSADGGATPAGLPPIVAIGASTGGPEAIAQVLGPLPPGLPAAVIVVQHISAEYAPGLVSWLQGRTALRVREAHDADPPTVGQVHVAATDDHLVLRADRRLAYERQPEDCPYRPSVDRLFESLAAHWPRPGVAVLLTGMGADGARGLGRLRSLGWHTIAQDEPTCVVYGMPRAAAEAKAALSVLPLSAIGPSVVRRIERLAELQRTSR